MKRARTWDNQLNIATRSLFYLSLGLLLACQTSPSIVLDTPLSPAEEVANRRNSTYTNEQLGLRFSYPQGYTVEELEQGVTVWRDADYENKEDFVEATPLTIRIEENPENLSPREWVQQRGYRIEGQIISQAVASSDAVMFEWLGMWAFRSVAIARSQSNQIAIVTLDLEMEEYQEVFEAILATLEFL